MLGCEGREEVTVVIVWFMCGSVGVPMGVRDSKRGN